MHMISACLRRSARRNTVHALPNWTDGSLEFVVAWSFRFSCRVTVGLSCGSLGRDDGQL
jgi:hypothetical protein